MKFVNLNSGEEIQVFKLVEGGIELVVDGNKELYFYALDKPNGWWINQEYSCNFDDKKLYLSEGFDIGINPIEYERVN